jgi:Protein of unknown function (DUF3352)
LPPASPSSPPPRAVAIAISAVLVAIVAGVVIAVVAGAGSSHTSGTSADPARAVPGSAPLYVGADVRPKGSKQAAALSAGRALTHQADPYMRLLSVLQTPGSPALNFSRDVAPWLGPRAGVFLSSLRSSGSLLALVQQGLLGQSSGAGSFPFGTNSGTGGAAGAQGAIVLDTRDMHKAKSFLEAAAARAGAHATSYRGVAYELSGGDVAFGIVQRFAVIGSDSGMHGVIDTTLGGPSLATAPPYAALLAFAPSTAVAHLYSNAGSAASAGTPSGVAGLLQLFSGGRQINVSLIPSRSSLALDVDTLALGAPSTATLQTFSSEASRALAELPGESWLAVGLGDVGHMLATDVQGLRSLGSLAGPQGSSTATGLNVKSLLEALITPLNVLAENTPEAKRSFQSWMGSAGVFATGMSLLELKAAVTIDSRNPALSHAAVAKLGARLRAMGGTVQPASLPGTNAAVTARLAGLPVALVIANGRGASGQTKFVIGIGESSVVAALNPPATLAGSPAASEAATVVGEGAQPSIIAQVPTLLSLLEGIGLTEDPAISGFVPYLRSVTTIAGGAHRLDAAVERFRLVIGLRPSG